MGLSKSGISTSECNITGMNDLGFWVLVNDMEYFIPFSDYPGFKDASINHLLNIRYYPPAQLHWKDLDMDIELDSLSHPESFPLLYK